VTGPADIGGTAMKITKNILLAIVAALAVVAGSTAGAAAGTGPPRDAVTITYPAANQRFNLVVADHVRVQVKARSSAGLPLAYHSLGDPGSGYGLPPAACPTGSPESRPLISWQVRPTTSIQGGAPRRSAGWGADPWHYCVRLRASQNRNGPVS
jgi:hypothetical protein